MTAQSLFVVIIVILVAGFMFNQALSYLNFSWTGKMLPEILSGIYDDKQYGQQQEYQRVNYRFGVITGLFSFLLIMTMLLTGGFAILDEWVRTVSDSPVWQAILFFGILGLASDLLSVPFDVYDTFVIEQKFGFNTSTVKIYILDKLKGWLLAGIIGGGLLALIVWIYGKTGNMFWIYVWGVITFFTVFINYFYTVLILPLFNKLTPLHEGELRDAINAFALKTGFGLKNIYTMDGSKRSTKGNAYFSGFGKQKKIVLYDTLIAEQTTDELVAVLAHEMGHYKHKHITKGLIISIIHTGVLLFIFSLIAGNPLLNEALGAGMPGFHLGLLTFGILYSPVSELLGIAMNVVSRRHEFQADAYAAKYHSSRCLQEALKKLASKNLSNLMPHPAYVFVHYSHPPLVARLQALQKFST